MKRLFFIVPYLLNNLLIGQYNMSNGALFTCSGTFYDSGGASGNYSDDENYVFTFYPGFWGSIVEISFTSYNSGSTDTISIFDGPDNSYPLLFSGGGNLSIPNLHSSDVTGALTIQFNSDATGNEFGWEAEIYCCMAAQYWYIDLDNDGFGSTSDFVFGCAPPSGYVANNDDCDDNSIMYEDLDGDGFGGNWQAGCGSYNSLDCSDNLLTYEDNDGDNYGNFEIFAPCGTTDNTDCNDLDDQINPGMSEISGNGMDDNC
ncbi:MAG: hypothetical protein JNJ99_15990, partial [Crocinitomicaceae bacterium]|nr:hypothetical protein [Crocinitomicaceae bacterium]